MYYTKSMKTYEKLYHYLSTHPDYVSGEALAQHLGIRTEEIACIGDGENDLSMFRYGRNCILMGHHSPELEPYATFVTKTVEEDGIAYAMKELGII